MLENVGQSNNLSRLLANESQRNRRRNNNHNNKSHYNSLSKTDILNNLIEFEQLESMITILVHFKYMLRFVNEHILIDSILSFKLNEIAPQFKADIGLCFDRYNQLIEPWLTSPESSMTGPGKFLQFIHSKEIEYPPNNPQYHPFKPVESQLNQLISSSTSNPNLDSSIESDSIGPSSALIQSFSLINDFLRNIASQQQRLREEEEEEENEEEEVVEQLQEPLVVKPKVVPVKIEPLTDERRVRPLKISKSILKLSKEKKKEKQKRTRKKPTYTSPIFSSVRLLSDTPVRERRKIAAPVELTDSTRETAHGDNNLVVDNNQNLVNPELISANNNNPNNIDEVDDLEIESDILQVEFWCSFQKCRFKSKSLATVKQHEEQRHVRQVLNCCQDGCSETFESKEDLDQHVLDAHSNSKTFLCTINGCNKKFPKITKLRAHIKELHKDAYLTCKLCDKVFKSRQNLTDHLRMIHDEGEYKCTEDGCDYVASIRQRLLDHKKSRHFKTRKCTVEGCGEMIARCRYNQHLISVHKISNYVCSWPDCGKAFGDNNKLKSHVRIHLNFKRFKCKWGDCTYASEQRHTVISHVRLCHFKLPRTKKKQMELNIPNNSATQNAYDFVETCREDICI